MFLDIILKHMLKSAKVMKERGEETPFMTCIAIRCSYALLLFLMALITFFDDEMYNEKVMKFKKSIVSFDDAIFGF